MINFKKTKLKNGLRIITAPIKETKAVTVLVLVGAGSRYEEKELGGISHFLEHMFFKGTSKRPSTLNISQELDSVGAVYNAFTSEEDTGFYVRVTSDHFDLALDVLVDMLFNSKFDGDEIKREKGVILEEINMYQDIPQRYIFDLTKKLFYGDTSLGRPTVGAKETVTKFTRNEFINYRDKFYSPNNMVIVVAGNPDKFNWIKEIEQYLGGYPYHRKADHSNNVVKQNEPGVLFYPKKTDQAHLTIGFRTFSRFDKKRPVLRMLNNLIGETMSSRLFTQVRERRGLAYYIGTDLWDFNDSGALISYAGVDLQKLELAVKVIVEEFVKLKKEKVSHEELVKARENLKGKMYLELEDSMSVASYLAERELHWQEVKDPDKIIEEIFKVTENDILSLSQELFQPKKLNFTVISPHSGNEKIKSILTSLK